MHSFERNKAGWNFTRLALSIKPRKTRPRKPRGLPTAWKKANHQLVDLFSRLQDLPKNNPDNYGGVFSHVAEIWESYGIDVSDSVVMNSYYPKKKTTKRNSRKAPS
jgi:hypothetical protein